MDSCEILCIVRLIFKRLVSTWEQHGGHHLWLFQRVDNAALEGLTDGRLQVAEGKEGCKGWDCHLPLSKAASASKRAGKQLDTLSKISVRQWTSQVSNLIGHEGPPHLPHPGETVLPKFVHDEAWSVWQVLDGNAKNNTRQRESEGSGVILSGGGLKQFEAAASNDRNSETNKSVEAEKKRHTAGCLAGCRWHLCRFWELAETAQSPAPSQTSVSAPEVCSGEESGEKTENIYSNYNKLGSFWIWGAFECR